jgi:hypothetical protein
VKSRDSLVELYRTPASARRSTSFRVLVEGGAEPFVEHWGEVSYARFALKGEARVEIVAAGSVGEVRVMPRTAVRNLVTEGDRIHLTLPRPVNLAVLVPGMERLFLLADPPETAPEPGAPGVVSATDYHADPTGLSLSTGPLQAAIDEVAARPGGGVVIVPEGTFLTGTLAIRSHVTLYLAQGAVLWGSADPADYPVDPGRRESGSDGSIVSADARYRGETMTFSRLVLFDEAEDAHLAGRGTIDGRGRHLRKVRNAVPNLIRVRNGRHLTIRDVLLRDAAAWTVHVLGARGVAIENLKILNDRDNLNTDGIDPDSSQDILIRGCLIFTKDDGVCVKATNNSGVLADVERVLVVSNVVSSVDAALKVGTESLAARFSDVVFRDNDVFDCDRAMSVVVRDGAAYDRIAFQGIRVGPRVKHLVEQVIGVREGVRQRLGRIEGLSFEDVEALEFVRPATNSTWYAQFRPGGTSEPVAVFQGADDLHAVGGLLLRRVVVNGFHLADRATAERIANLTIGPFVEGVVIE